MIYESYENFTSIKNQIFNAWFFLEDTSYGRKNMKKKY